MDHQLGTLVNVCILNLYNIDESTGHIHPWNPAKRAVISGVDVITLSEPGWELIRQRGDGTLRSRRITMVLTPWGIGYIKND